MEIFIRNVDFFTSQHDVIRALAAHLHQPPYTTGLPLNFHVRMFKPKPGKRGNHSGQGTMTLPSIEIGRHFLDEYGDPFPRRSVSVRGRPMKFTLSRNELSQDILIGIRNSDYLDPEVREERERVAQYLKNSIVSVERVQFGWDCRDQVLSIEWDYVSNGARALFSAEERRLEVDIPRKNYDLGSLGDLLSTPSQIVSIDFSIIEYITCDSQAADQPSIVMVLTNPPQYLESSPFASLMDVSKTRRPALDMKDTTGRPHSEVAPYVSSVVRLVCSSLNDLRVFRDLADTAGLNITIQTSYYPIARRDLFSAESLFAFTKWLKSLDFQVAFQIEKLVNDLCVDPKEIRELNSEIQELISDSKKLPSPTQGVDYILNILRDFGVKVFDFWDEGDYTLQQFFRKCRRNYASTFKPLTAREDDGIFLCMHVQITPTGKIFTGPIPERSNRVIRQYSPENHQNFLRVSFLEEGRLQLQFVRGVDGKGFVKRRIGPFFEEGLQVAGRTFTFLGYSQSALKEHAVYFMAPFVENGQVITTQTIIESLGTFSGLESDPRLMHCPARYAARISQGFTSTDPTFTEIEHLVENGDDIISHDSQGNKWTHTDGVGTMSSEFARKVFADRQQTRRRGRTRPLREYARALQIRIMGCKGMLSVDERLVGLEVHLRRSMTKFDGATSRKIEIAKIFSQQALDYDYEGLGVPYETFKHFQDLAVNETEEATDSFENASYFLQSHGLGTSFRIPSVLLSLSKLTITSTHDNGFYERVMEYGKNHVLRLLKHRARIPVPKAWNLVGVADIQGYLPPKHIFACVRTVQEWSKPIYLKGPVLISRSPTIHPGDVQIVTAIGPPPPGSYFEKNDLANTVVFSTTDERPLPSCLGGGDLDGDEYNVIPLEELPEFWIDPSRIQTPGSYPAAKRHELDRPCTMKDVGDFVMEYITSDVLGMISINWRILADQTDIFNPDCMKMAELHSLAVDYPKSGNPVPIQGIPKRKNTLLPDWYAPETMFKLDLEKYYPSQKAIGRLFRDIQLTVPQYATRKGKKQKGRFWREQREAEEMDDLADMLEGDTFSDSRVANDPLYHRVRCEVSTYITVQRSADHEIEERITNLFQGYRSELEAICSAHTLAKGRGAMLTEEEATVGTIVANTSQPRKRLDHIGKLREQTETLVSRVRETLDGDDDTTAKECLQQTFFAWRFARMLCDRKTPPFGARSFWWVTLSAVFEAIKEIEKKKVGGRAKGV